MWENKTFKTQAELDAWLIKNRHRYQTEVIFVNNTYGVVFRKLRRIG
jgi:hypothetical protein